MVVVRVLDHVDHAYNSTDGQMVYDQVLPYMQRNEVVFVSFDGIDSLPSSFVNAAFIQLLDTFSFDKIKELLRFTSSTQQINEMIRSRFSFEVERAGKQGEKIGMIPAQV